MTPCILHTQKGNKDGYGNKIKKIKGRKHQFGLHVWALMKATEEDPAGRHALHVCDNPRCINPEHLWWGSAKENAQDRNAKGRGYVGGPVPRRS